MTSKTLKEDFYANFSGTDLNRIASEINDKLGQLPESWWRKHEVPNIEAIEAFKQILNEKISKQEWLNIVRIVQDGDFYDIAEILSKKDKHELQEILCFLEKLGVIYQSRIIFL